jgi:hypothetical protein
VKGLILFILMATFTGWDARDFALAAGNADDGAYEIDYEEETEESETQAEATPSPKAGKVAARPKVGGGGPAVQGSRAKNRFAPILKSETRSVYKKDGKTLDVDTD